MTVFLVVFFHSLAFFTDSCDNMEADGSEILLATIHTRKLAEIFVIG